MKHKLQTLLSAAVGVMLALPASAARVDNRVFIEDAVSGYGTDTGWSLAGGADASQVEVSGGVMSFDLDADQNVTYTPANPSAAGKAATVEVADTTFSVAYEPPADLPEGSQASIVLGQWADGATGPTYYGWAGETNATGALVWTQLDTTVVSDPTAAVDVKMVFDYTNATKTVTFFVEGTQVGLPLALADQTKTQVSAVSFSGAGSIADLDGTYAVNVYTVTFKDEDAVVDTVEVDEGEAVAAADVPAAPAKTGYTFDAWQSNGSNYDFSSAVTQDFFVTAKYDLNEYVITWLDGDGNSLGTSTVTHGATPAYTGATPTKTETTEYTYTFNDTWSPAIVPATAAATYTAQFDAVAKAFTITFVDEDGTTVLGTSRTLPGVVPVYEGETPAKASDNQNDYTFGGWSPALVAATGPTTYTATYSSTPRNYTITWNFKAADGTDTSDTSTVHWGDTPSHADPAGYVANNTIYAFQAWSPAPAAYDGTVAAYTATYTSTAAKATVITVTGVTTNTVGTYATLAEAVSAAQDGQTVLLLDDVTLTERVEPNVGANTAITIDLGGNTITRTGTTGNGSAFDVKSGDVTIQNGTIDCTQDDTAIAADGVYAITSRSGSTVTLADLDITVDSECGACAYPFAGSTMTIESGTYANVTTTPYRYNTAITGMAVNQPNNATQNLIIKGGSFSQYDPQLGDDSGFMTDFTDEGFVAIDDGNGNWVVQPGYNVTFVDEDGNVLETQRVPAGETPVYGGAAPAKASTDSAVYAFAGWTPAIVAAAADTTYTAQFSSIYLDPASLELYPNCSNFVYVVGAPAGSTYTYKFAGQVGCDSYALNPPGWSKTEGWAWPYGKQPGGTGTITVTVSNNNAQVAQFVANVTVKDVAAVVDGVEYASADFANALAAAKSGDKVLEMYYYMSSYGKVALAEGESIRWKPADNRGKASLWASAATIPATTDTAWYEAVASKDNETGVTTITCVNQGVPYVKIDDGTTVTYSTKSFTSMSKAGATYTLLRDMTNQTGGAVSKSGVVLDLNGKKLGLATGIKVTAVNTAASLTIRDTSAAGTGEISGGNNDSPLVWVLAGDTVTIESGTFVSDGSTAVYTSDGGTATISGGTFSATTASGLLNCNDSNKGTITVTGGSFQGFDPANNAADGADTDYVATGYVSVADDPSSGWYTVYEAVTVTFVNAKGDAPEAQVIGKGKTATAPADPEAEGFDFNGWFADGASEAFDFATPVSADLTLTAQWTAKTFTILWVVDGQTVETDENVAYNATPAYDGATPAKGATAQYTYTFAGWTPEVVAATADATYTATFTETVNKYTVTFKNGDTVVSEAQYDYGTLAANVAVPADLADYSTDSTVYEFSGWGTVADVTADAVYSAVWNETTRKYTVTFKNGDTVVSEAEYDYGTLAANVTVPADLEDYSTETTAYEFVGWGTVADVTADAVYTAEWNATPLAPPAIDGVTLALKGNVYLDAVSITNPAVVKFVATTNGAAADVTPTVTASAGAATVSGDTVTFTGVPWNDPVDWTLAYNDATLPGRFYAKAEKQWFSAAADSLTDIQGLADGMKGVEPATESATNQMVRIEVTIEIPDGAMESLPTGTDVGDTRTGFAVAQLSGDAAPAYYGYNGTDWVKLVGAAPAANTEVDLLIVLDTAESKARYYVDGVALSTTNATPVYAIPMKAGDAVIKGIGFANPEGVKSAVVAEYDVPYAAAVGDTPYMVGAEGVAAADKTGTDTLYLLENGITGSVTLDDGDILVVDRTKGDDLGLAVSAATGCELTSTTNGTGTVVTWTAAAAASVDPEAVDPGDSLTAADLAKGVIPAGVVTETDPDTQEETQYFVVNFRAPQAGITYTLMTTTDLTLTTDEWKGIGEVGEVATKAAGDEAEKVSTEAHELITLKTPMTGNAAFFKIKASVGN